MYTTADGDRKLTNAGRRLAIAALHTFLDNHQPDLGLETGIAVVDQIPAADLPLAATTVVEHLLSSSPAPERRAWHDGIVWLLYDIIVDRVDMEIESEEFSEDKGKTRYWRTLVLDAHRQDFKTKKKKPENVDWEDLEGFTEKIEMVRDMILPDYDFDHYERFADANPDHIAMVKAVAGIDDKFFEDAGPVLKPEDRTRLESFAAATGAEFDTHWRGFSSKD